jgi:halocyanin-like protein
MRVPRTETDERKVSRRWLLRSAAGGAAAAFAAGSATAQENGGDGSDGGTQRPDFGGWLSDVDGGYRDARGEDVVTVRVGASGNGGSYAFLPAGLWIDPGTTVEFEWTGEGGAHNVVADEGPAALDSGDPTDTSGVAYEYEFTEDDAGITNYICEPHVDLGMIGAIAVGDDVPTVTVDTGGEAAGPGFWQRTENQLAVLFYGLIGLPVATILLIDAYTQLEEHGGVRGPEPATAGGVSTEATTAEPVTELDHDEYDPVGTATLIAGYLAILVLMWLFMYFVEFLGNGPTVIG